MRKDKSFNFTKTSIEEVFVIERKSLQDNRGFFSRFFCSRDFEVLGLDKPIVQINQSFTKRKGTIRGMHFQHPPNSETKIVTCVEGEVFDVVVDIRRGSPTFLQWHAEILSEDNQLSLYIPDGFAHGFQTITDDCRLLYLHTEFYDSESQGILNVFDSGLSIEWPFEITEISDRDRDCEMISKIFLGV